MIYIYLAGIVAGIFSLLARGPARLFFIIAFLAFVAMVIWIRLSIW